MVRENDRARIDVSNIRVTLSVSVNELQLIKPTNIPPRLSECFQVFRIAVLMVRECDRARVDV